VKRPIIIWFRRDLRIDDNPALFHAAAQGAPVIPLFVFDAGLVRSLPSDGAAFDFQAEALAELDEGLRALGGKLVTRRGSVQKVHESLIRETQPAALYYNRDYEPYARVRDQEIESLYHRFDIEVRSFADVVVHEPHEVLTGKGTPFVVFTPYANAWKKLEHPKPLRKPKSITTPRLTTQGLLGAAELGRRTSIHEPAFRGGEKKAHHLWHRFLRSKIKDYEKSRDIPSVEGTSRLSAHLRFGCISVRRVLDDCIRLQNQARSTALSAVSKYVDELIWREFYQAVLYHYPELVIRSYRAEFDSMPWKMDGRMFDAWCRGATGFPLVDAGMRQLNRTGWMHNRVRMVVASFLTKDLRHDWRLGASYFEKMLMDIETASNNGGWQWAASTGVDPKPLRIFNPRLQAERFDTEGLYIKTFVPELRSVPVKFIHAPHTMPPALQKEVGCVIGKDYPHPIVDHAVASGDYKRLVASLKSDFRKQ
jgi:deoxyribodipyrimidine photo-lyase